MIFCVDINQAARATRVEDMCRAFICWTGVVWWSLVFVEKPPAWMCAMYFGTMDDWNDFHACVAFAPILAAIVAPLWPAAHARADITASAHLG